MANWIIESPGANQPESYLEQAGRIGKTTAIKSLESIDALTGLIGGERAPKLANYAREKLGVTPEQEEPQGFLESAAHKFGQAAPFAAGIAAAVPALGGSVLGALGTTAIGSLAGAGAKELGASEWMQDLAQIGTEIATGIPISGLKKTKNIADVALRASVPGGKKHLFKHTPVALGVIKNALPTAGKSINKKVKDALAPVYKNLKRSKGDPVKLLDARKWLNAEMYKWPKAVRLSFGQPVSQAITQDLVEYGAKNPEFLKHLNTRDGLTVLEHMKTPTVEMLERLPIVGERLGKKFIETLGLGEKFFRGTGILGGKEVFRGSKRGIPAARKLYADMTLSALSNDPEKVIKYGNELKRYIPGFEKDEDQFPKSNEWIIEQP